MAFWKIDPAHSEITFKVRHLVVSNVTGHFAKFDASIDAASPDFSDAVFTFEADIDSISTKNADRDAHLKSPDFFDAPSHPKMTFVSRSVKSVSDYELEVIGDLSLRGTTKEVKLDVIYNGTVAGFGGVQVAGFEIKTKINRMDFGLVWNAMTEAGGVVVSNEVRIEIQAEFNQAASAQAAA